MTQYKGIDWQNNSFVVGTRADVAPVPTPQPAFTRQCAECRHDTLTEVQYPQDVPIVCNVCAALFTKQLEEDPDTSLLWDMPIAVKARLIDEAHKRNMPVEEIFNKFLA